jgi:hypothetical protein
LLLELDLHRKQATELLVLFVHGAVVEDFELFLLLNRFSGCLVIKEVDHHVSFVSGALAFFNL